jgi:hypothetical protein
MRKRPMALCRECAIRCEPLYAKVRFFDTDVECFRAGLVKGKLLIPEVETRRFSICRSLI